MYNFPINKLTFNIFTSCYCVFGRFIYNNNIYIFACVYIFNNLLCKYVTDRLPYITFIVGIFSIYQYFWLDHIGSKIEPINVTYFQIAHHSTQTFTSI